MRCDICKAMHACMYEMVSMYVLARCNVTQCDVMWFDARYVMYAYMHALHECVYVLCACMYVMHVMNACVYVMYACMYACM